VANWWTCPCGTRNERIKRKCSNTACNRSRPRKRRPAHTAALDHDFAFYANLNETVHGVDEDTCALCGKPGRSDIRLQRDHAHHGGGYPRGLLHALCNARLGGVERGRPDAEEWLEQALAYVRRSRTAHLSEENMA
jgi:hypothetical protein